MLRNHTYRVLLVGDAGVGKSSLLSQFVNYSYSDNYQTTIALDYQQRTLPIEHTNITLHLFDLAGKEQYRDIRRAQYRGDIVILFVYDVTDDSSFLNVGAYWLTEINSAERAPEPSYWLVGTKCDQINHKVVDHATAKQFAELHGMRFMEVSAKTSTNVHTLFERIVRELFQRNIYHDFSRPPRSNCILC